MDIPTRIVLVSIISLGVGLLALKWRGRNPVMWTLIPFLYGMLFPGLAYFALLLVLLLAFMSKAPKDTA